MSSRQPFTEIVQQHVAALSTPSRSGYVAEALVFLYLKSSPVVRSAEFSSIDGAIYMNWPGGPPELYSQRIEEVAMDKSLDCCINFDVKTHRFIEQGGGEGQTRCVGWKGSRITVSQRQECAFVICLLFGPSNRPSREWAALFPTQLYHGVVCRPQMAYNEVYSWSSVDPALHPYILPIDQLPAAVQRVADATRQKQRYINPWSGVSIQWTPKRSSSHIIASGRKTVNEAIKASQLCLGWIQEAVAKSHGAFKYELNEVQPLLGDFVLIGPDGSRHLFEHKVNQFIELADGVNFQLTYNDAQRNPFHPLRLWDFIFWHGHGRRIAYCIPRNQVPDRFCVERSTNLCAKAGEIGRWRLKLDEEGVWLQEMFRDIIVPYRAEPLIRSHLLPTVLKNFDLATDAVRGRELPNANGDSDEFDQVVDESGLIIEDTGLAPDSLTGKPRCVRGYGQYGLVSILQELCAKSGFGVILPLWRHCPSGDYVFCPWRWTNTEIDEFWRSGTLPIDLIDRRIRPQTTVCIPIVTFACYSELDGGKIVAPSLSHRYGGNDQRDEYFLTRETPFIVLADPSPAPISQGQGNMSHPYFMIASEHLRRPNITDLRRSHSLRHWLKDCCDPYQFAVPIPDIYNSLKAIVYSVEAQVNYCVHVSPISNTDYKLSFSQILQAQAQAAEDDAYMTQQLTQPRKKFTHLIKLSKR